MSRWARVEAIIRIRNPEGAKKILSEQKHVESLWSYYTHPYRAFSGSEGDACLSVNEEFTEFYITGELRDVECSEEQIELLKEDFKKIIELTNGQGYVEMNFDYEGTALVEYYDDEGFKYRFFHEADGFSKYYDKKKKGEI